MGIYDKLNEQLDQPAERRPFRWWHIPLLLLLIGATVYVAVEYNSKTKGPNPNASAAYLQCEGNIFGTVYHITYQSSADLADSITRVLQTVDNSLSPFNPNSVITAINTNRSMQTDSMFREVFLLAKAVSEVTDGAFDITVAPLVNAWGFGFKNKENVTDSLLQSILQHVGIEKVSLVDDEIVKTDTCVMLDCSAIAKGYGVDAVGQYLESKGVENYMVEIGGEVRLRGHNATGAEWNIGVVKPDPDALGSQNELMEVLHLTDISMATSGNYRNFYEEGGKRYAHTIDPRTGRPVQHSILSSTVLADRCALADAFATAFMVLGLDSAQTILQSHPELKAYFIYADKDGNDAVWKNF